MAQSQPGNRNRCSGYSSEYYGYHLSRHARNGQTGFELEVWMG